MFRPTVKQIIILAQGFLLVLFLNFVGLAVYLLWIPATPFYVISLGLGVVVALLVCGIEEEIEESYCLYDFL